jgi:uncharacterized protein with NRDE domain
MCILALAWRAHPRWLLVVAANRDEVHARPAAPLARWDEPKWVIAGRDLRSGGTWLGVSEQGRFAAVTNLRGYGPPDLSLTSRGELVTSLLTADRGYEDAEEPTPERFNPCNAVAVDGSSALLLSNRPVPERRRLTPGIYGVSNGALDERWPKTERLTERLASWMVRGDRAEILLESLRDDAPLDDGSPYSSVFVLDPVYGTRCSTVVAVDAEGRGLMIERSYTPDGQASGEVALRFAWQT